MYFKVLIIALAPLLLQLCIASDVSNVTAEAITTEEFISSTEEPPPERFQLHPIVINGRVGQSDTRKINNTVEFIYVFTFDKFQTFGDNGDVKNEDIRIHVEVDEESDVDFPVTFVVRQQKSSLAWQLPVLSKFDGKEYRTASRTLCTENDIAVFRQNNSGTFKAERIVEVSVSTSSNRSISFSLNVSVENNFVMILDQPEVVDVSPLSPRFFEFVFPPSRSRFVLLEVTSNDSSCMTVSVQNSSCPILDQENNVQFVGYWQTMSKKAGMTLRKEDFPYGFYVVFVMHGDDTRCKRAEDGDEHDQPLLYETPSWRYMDKDRIKIVEFVIREKITDIEYLSAIFGTGGLFGAFYLFVFIISCTYSCRTRHTATVWIDAEEGTINGESSRPPETSHSTADTCPIVDQPSRSQILPPTTSQDAQNEDDEEQHWLEDSDSSLDETDIDFMADANREKDVYRAYRGLCVAHLARKNPRILAKKSQLYLYTLFTVAVFYGLPVVQLVFTYQKVLHTTGNQDLCYYNYLCSHPLWLLSDFNHVYSNVGYISLGLLFLLLVMWKERRHEKLVAQHSALELRFGIPCHFGLFYAMGFALIMEGVLSACYHVCPNHSNFQFDTCFMYVNAILCMLKIYQTRHPDINASAYMAFTSLAFVVLLGVVGVLAGNLYFWIAFTVFHVLVCMFLTVQIYYLGRWRLDLGVFQRIYQTWKNDCLASPIACLTPLYIDRMILLTVANICNWAIAGYGMWKMPQDFASHLLLIFMSNLFLYSNFYFMMKLTHKEKISCQPAIYILLSICFWALSLYVFIHKSTSWQLSPAESRNFNRECMLLRFYDTHDIWHFLSAFSMFFSFMILLTLDDDLIFVPRTKIAVF